MCSLNTWLDWGSKAGSILSSLGLFYVAFAYREQRRQNQLDAKYEVFDRYSSLFHEANRLFSDEQFARLNNHNWAEDQKNEIADSILLEAAPFFDKLDFALGQAKLLNEARLIERLISLAKAAVHQAREIAAARGREFSLSIYDFLPSVISKEDPEKTVQP